MRVGVGDKSRSLMTGSDRGTCESVVVMLAFALHEPVLEVCVLEISRRPETPPEPRRTPLVNCACRRWNGKPGKEARNHRVHRGFAPSLISESPSIGQERRRSPSPYPQTTHNPTPRHGGQSHHLQVRLVRPFARFGHVPTPNLRIQHRLGTFSAISVQRKGRRVVRGGTWASSWTLPVNYVIQDSGMLVPPAAPQFDHCASLPCLVALAS